MKVDLTGAKWFYGFAKNGHLALNANDAPIICGNLQVAEICRKQNEKIVKVYVVVEDDA